jgi:uncharacterized protein
MKKARKKSAATTRRNTPIILIGGILLVLAVGFVVVSKYMISNRSDDATRTLAERRAAGSDGVIQFRNDARLSFINAEGRESASISVEIAETEEQRTQGLMGRTRMDERQGMLFIFPDEEYRSFWMVNTPLSLDIIYVNSDRKIVTIRRNTVPFSEESIPSSAPARFVIEVNAGFCDRNGIVEGGTVFWTRTGG